MVPFPRGWNVIDLMDLARRRSCRVCTGVRYTLTVNVLAYIPPLFGAAAEVQFLTKATTSRPALSLVDQQSVSPGRFDARRRLLAGYGVHPTKRGSLPELPPRRLERFGQAVIERNEIRAAARRCARSAPGRGGASGRRTGRRRRRRARRSDRPASAIPAPRTAAECPP